VPNGAGSNTPGTRKSSVDLLRRRVLDYVLFLLLQEEGGGVGLYENSGSE
jgi:hypothetical protein